MSNSIWLTSAVVAILFISGCAPKQQSLYSYHNYSSSYYQFKQDATPESLAVLQMEIEKVLASKDEGRSERVPPGIYANLGYIYLQNGNVQKALKNFELEKQIYPEATKFMDMMINKVNAAEEQKVHIQENGS